MTSSVLLRRVFVKLKKKILMLGGAYSQIPAIQYARAAGYHVLTCDYLPDNPGHQYAHQFFNVSTTDKEKVLHLAREMAIDGIVAYASDPSAPAAAYICDALRPAHPTGRYGYWRKRTCSEPSCAITASRIQLSTALHPRQIWPGW
jgi:hypothetical protein